MDSSAPGFSVHRILQARILEWVAISFSRTGVLSPLLYPGYKEWGRGLVSHLLIGWGTYTWWGKSKANTFSLCAAGERQVILLRRTWNLLIVTTWGREGRWGSGFSIPAFQDPPCFYLFFCPWVTTESSWNGEILRRQNLQHLVTLLGMEHREELGCIPEPWLLPASPASLYSPFHPVPRPCWLSSCWASFHSLSILCSSWPLHLCVVFLCLLHMHFFFLPGVIFTITLPFPILLPS